jgi:transcription initiation factor TFIID subunit 13
MHIIWKKGLMFFYKQTLFLLFQTKRALEVGRQGRISVEDIIFLIRKDPKKYSRVKELLTMSEELRKARKAFDEIKYATTK